MSKETKNKVLIIVPVATNLDIKVPTAMWLVTLMNMKANDEIDFEFNVSVVPSHSPAIGRNVAISKNLDKDYTHFFFLDSDVYPHSPNVIEKMIKEDKEVISGMYPLYMKNSQKLWSVQFDTPCGPDWVQLSKIPTEPFKSVGFGAGFMLIKKSIFEEMPSPWFEFKLKDDGMVQTGEDIAFCRALLDMGKELWIEPAAICGHYKTVDLLQEWGIV